MLAGIRKYTRGFVALLFVALLAVAFVIWEIRDVFSPQVGNDIASGEGVKVSPQEFKLEWDQELRRVQAQQKDETITARDLMEAGSDASVIQRLIATHAANALARRMGFAASDAMVLQDLQSGFKDPVTGRFSPEVYRRLLAGQGVTPAFFEGYLRDEMVRRQMFRAVTGSVRAPSSYGRIQYLLLSERRIVSFSRILPTRAPLVKDPTDTELTAWYTASPPSSFMRPEQRKLMLFIADPKRFSTQVQVKPEDLTRQVEFELARSGAAEKRSFVQVAFARTDRAKADQAAARLKAGADPDAVAKEFGGQVLRQEPTDKKLLGDSPLAAAVFAAANPSDIGVVDTGLGFAAVRVTSITPAVSADRAAVEKRVRDTLIQREAQTLIQKALDEYNTAKANGDDDKTAAKTAGLEIVEVDYVDARGANDNGLPVAEVAGLGDKMRDVFAAAMGESTEFVSTTDGRWVAANVVAVRAAGLRPLDSVRAAALAAYKQEKNREAIVALGEAVVADVKAGKSFKDALAARGLSVEAANVELTRETVGSSPFAPVAGQVFNARPGVAGAAPVGPQVVLFYLERIERADPDKVPALVEQRRLEATGMVRESLVTGTTTLALSDARARVNQARLDAAVGRARKTDAAQ
jgi:peptidyl-prolyl cis-trans isomerase D